MIPYAWPRSQQMPGLGAQKNQSSCWRPVAYVSWLLTDVEKRIYTNWKGLLTDVEKRIYTNRKGGLAVTWASEKFSDYVLRMKFVLETDHKPLLPLLNVKHLHVDDLPPRILRFRHRRLVSSILWNTNQESPSIQLIPSLEHPCPSPKREIKVTDKRQNSGYVQLWSLYLLQRSVWKNIFRLSLVMTCAHPWKDFVSKDGQPRTVLILIWNSIGRVDKSLHLTAIMVYCSMVQELWCLVHYKVKHKRKYIKGYSDVDYVHDIQSGGQGSLYTNKRKISKLSVRNNQTIPVNQCFSQYYLSDHGRNSELIFSTLTATPIYW